MKNPNAAWIAVVGLASCAQMSAFDSSPEGQCQNFANQDGLAVVRVEGVDVVGTGHNVRLRLGDGLGRHFNATCNTAGGPHWTEPLPSNVARSQMQLRR